MSKSSSRKWIRIRHRINNEYIQGVRYFMEFVKFHSPPDFELCSCPCIRCRNSKKLHFKIVEKHLIVYGMDPTYDEWFFHGERSDNDTALIEAAEERQKSESSVNGGGDGIRSLEDFERDHVAEAFGDDRKRSYCHAISSTSNAKKVKLVQGSKAILNYQESGDQHWRTKMQNSLNQMYDEIKRMSSAVSDMRQCIKLLVNQIGGNVTTSRPKDASNTEQNITYPEPHP